MGRYNKNFQEGKLLLPSFRGLSNQNGNKDIIQDNNDKSYFFSLYLILLQIAQDNQYAAKMPTKNLVVISVNKVLLLINLRYNQSHSNLFKDFLIYLR